MHKSSPIAASQAEPAASKNRRKNKVYMRSNVTLYHLIPHFKSVTQTVQRAVEINAGKLAEAAPLRWRPADRTWRGYIVTC
jgi:hypothetical protein